ncbi:MAG: kinase/pyrophosphorylase, partial [Planctomycetia bacterium]|nr:kinase/pyrophosphorylase [Planctomycetia bacterium]
MKAKPRHVHDSQVRRPGDAARKGVDQAAALIVYAVSGGTGRTAQFVVEAALSQFDNPAVKVEIRPRTRTAQAARDVVQEAARSGGVICHTLVAPPVRRALIQEAERQAVPTFDPL